MKFRSRLIVDLNNLKYNHDQIKKIAPHSKILFMVKADGYGHGMISVARFACTELGIQEFGCATIKEALSLREELNDLEFDVYVFSDIQLELHENADIYLKKRIIPVISNVSELEYILQTSEFRNFPICLKFNTGMNRLGLGLEEQDEVISLLNSAKRNSIYHLISHFANGSFSMIEDKYNQNQINNFNMIKKKFSEAGIILERTSQANSGSIEQKNGVESDTHIRPGLMMYGPSSLNEDIKSTGHFNGKLVSKLETYILRTFDVTAGTPVGYNSTPCPEDGLIAILAIGYGDGFSNRYSGVKLLHNGFEGYLIGRVSMDMAHVFFPKEARGHIKAHEVFTIWGEQGADLVKFSKETKTIPYELFCSILPRIPRVYRLN
jgi:alanine racemase